MRHPFSSLFLIVALLLAPAAAQAYHFRMADGTNALVLAADESLPDETGMLGQELDIRGRADHDLWLAANSVRFVGDCAGDLRLLARSAVLSGTAQQNLLAYAAGLQMATNAVIHGQVALFGNHVICEGQIDGDAWIVAQSATLGGQWGGTVRVQADEIRVAPNTVIAGDLVYAAPKAPVFYTVKKGDNLWEIAETVYGKGKGTKNKIIFEANKPMLKSPDKIYPGQVLRIPQQ